MTVCIGYIIHSPVIIKRHFHGVGVIFSAKFDRLRNSNDDLGRFGIDLALLFLKQEFLSLEKTMNIKTTLVAVSCAVLMTACAVNQNGRVTPDGQTFNKQNTLPLGAGLLGAAICNQLFKGHGSQKVGLQRVVRLAILSLPHL